MLGYRNHRVGGGRFKIVVNLRADTNNNNAQLHTPSELLCDHRHINNVVYNVVNIGHIRPYKMVKSDKRRTANGKYNK